MSVPLRYLILRPFKVYVVDLKEWRYAFGNYFKIYSEDNNTWVIGFEDHNDFDYDEPKLEVSLTDDFNIRITGISYSGIYRNRLYYGNELIFDLKRGNYTDFGTKTVPLCLGLNDIGAILLYLLQKVTVNVDTLATELSITDEIKTSEKSPPVTILVPPTGKRISTRGSYLFSDSDAGEVEMRYMNSGKLISKIYCSKFKVITLPEIRLDGEVDEAIGIYWNNLSTNAKIAYVLNFKVL